MAAKTPREPGSDAPFATRIDPAKDALTKEQLDFIRQVESNHAKKRAARLLGRNAATGLAIGALVLGIYGYTFYSVSQEHIIEEMDEEARLARARGSKASAN